MINKTSYCIFVFTCVFILFSCKDHKNLYEKNLNLYKDLVNNLNTYFLDTNNTSINLSKYFSEDFVFSFYPVGHKKGLTIDKDEYIDSVLVMKKNNFIFNIVHSIYLPGLDEQTYNIDGSVRVYYGAILTNDSINIEFSAYQTVNYVDGKINGIWEWADYSGIKQQMLN